MPLPSLEDLKAQAKRLRDALPEKARAEISHGQALDLVARQHGFRDWNTLHAAKGNRPELTLTVGDRVCGHYLDQAFSGEVLAVSRNGQTGDYQLTLHFDEPVDVVTFDSFSNFRHRVTTSIRADGQSTAKTSDGTPHMRLQLDL